MGGNELIDPPGRVSRWQRFWDECFGLFHLLAKIGDIVGCQDMPPLSQCFNQFPLRVVMLALEPGYRDDLFPQS